MPHEHAAPLPAHLHSLPLLPQEAPAAPPCTDVPPDDRFTCQQQADFGKCQQSWMVEGNFCETTCGRNGCGAPAGEAPGATAAG